MLHLHVWKDYLEKQETDFKKETEKYRCYYDYFCK